MGKTSRWFRSLFGAKKLSDSPASKEKKTKWGLVKSFNGNDCNNGGTRGSIAEASSTSPFVEAVDANKHAIAVAAATAAVAEAALAAAQAAAEVVRLTSGASRPASAYFSGGSDRRRELAAVKIQSAFRAYLARRALRALKGLVKLQALVRGHMVRKQSANMLQRMQAMARIQARASANRASMSESSHSSSKSSHSHRPGLATPKKYNYQHGAYSSKPNGSILKMQRSGSKSDIKDNVGMERTPRGSNWLDHWMEESSLNFHRNTFLKRGHAIDEKSDKILEIDTWKPHLNPKRSDKTFQASRHDLAWNRNEQISTAYDSLSRHSTRSEKPNPCLSSKEMPSLRSLKFPLEVDQGAVWTAENSPIVHSACSRPGSSGKRGPFTPARSECSQSFFSNYLGYPNYMANTESSRAKVRSQSAPRQRMQFEKPGSSSTNWSGHGFWNADAFSERDSGLHANFRSKAYPGGHLDRHWMPVPSDTAGNGSSYGSGS